MRKRLRKKIRKRYRGIWGMLRCPDKYIHLIGGRRMKGNYLGDEGVRILQEVLDNTIYGD